MARLTKEEKELLNKFSDTQPALQLPGRPSSQASMKIGDILDSALAKVEEALADLAALTAKLDTDTGVTDTDYHEITDDNA